jgi:hypothetical protein
MRNWVQASRQTDTQTDRPKKTSHGPPGGAGKNRYTEQKNKKKGKANKIKSLRAWRRSMVIKRREIRINSTEKRLTWMWMERRV